ncbi:HAD family hydrolase [Olsenella sp. HMSC062G07]|uniref:HAD family hydrolase n=1 Tax=Olsenella sp. HMSC062G07 TaxID=1739330 RepID=UPI0008A64661|nr:HAD family hydrolase [Olsenella sp. HMSC062G07]OFK22691.1 hypothetical protein HMPREF2826_01110 [Olsenella sp. HMSC062G07]
MVRLVLTDMDMTLLPFGQPASEKAMAAIHSLVGQGIFFGPASGRDWDSVLESFRGDPLCMRTALLSNGKKVYAHGALVSKTSMDRDSIVTMAKMVYDLPGVYISGRGDEGGFISGTTLDNLLRTEWGSRRADEICEPEGIPSWPIVTAGLHFEDGSEDIDNNFWADEIRAACPRLDLISPGSRMFDCVPKGWSKATGLGILQDILHIDGDEVVCFGDSDNDYQLLQSVTHSVAVANANECVSAVARYHIGSCEQDSVGQALEDLATLGEGAFEKWDRAYQG